MRKIVVGFSGGVTSSEAAVLALAEYPREEVVLLWHDTKDEDVDTYRFLRESAAWIGLPITERSDGRSVEEVELDEGALANNRMAFCSRILKAQQWERYLGEIRGFDRFNCLYLNDETPTEVIKLLGFSSHEWKRIQRQTMIAERDGFRIRFILNEKGISKQQCADNWIARGIRPPSMYKWSDHANCVNCRRGGKAYMIASAQHHPAAFVQLIAHEKNPAFNGHTIFKDGSLEEIVRRGLKRRVNRKESIDLGPCECGS